MAHTLQFKPIVLKQLSVECDIPQTQYADLLGLKRPTVNLMINRGYIPPTVEGCKQKVEAFIAANDRAVQWLMARGMGIPDIWTPVGMELRKAHPVGSGRRTRTTMLRAAAVPGNADEITINWEVEMINPEALKHFKLFRNPFTDDITRESDIFMSDEHRYIEAAMLDAARHGGFLAIIGEVGSGKSIMRRKVIEQLRKDGDVLVIYPQMIDKARLTVASICDAIISDISSEKPKAKHEMKARQVQRLLLDRSKNNYRSVLIVEEAHDLSANVFKYLKRFYELEDGYRKLLGIILIGQTELKQFFNEAQHVDMREVIRRVQVAEISGLNGNLKDYLTLKFKRVGGDIDKIFTPDAFAALKGRLSTKDRTGKVITHAYPLLVNNYAAKACNMACELGETMVTADVINAL